MVEASDSDFKCLESLYGDSVVARYNAELPSDDSSLVSDTDSTPDRPLDSRVVRWLRDVFLPEGYPHSVSEDYLEYQIWDTCQAYCSSISATLATQSVLEGMGVGDAEATALAATITWILKDGCGMMGRILFAWRFSSSLDAHCKQWRLFADVLNDLAISAEMMASLVDSSTFKVTVVCSALAKSVVAVAGGATRAAIVQHQARSANMADVCAKDGSQETMVNLAALLTSLLLLPLLTSGSTVSWLLFLALTALHVWCNYRAVRSMRLSSLNRPRLTLLLDTFLTACDQAGVSWREQGAHVNIPETVEHDDLTVDAVNRREPLWFYDNHWRHLTSGFFSWRLEFGASVERALLAAGPSLMLDRIRDPLCRFAVVPGPRGAVCVLLEEGISDEHQLWSLMVAYIHVRSKSGSDDAPKAHWAWPKMWSCFRATLQRYGWDLNRTKLDPGQCRYRILTKRD